MDVLTLKLDLIQTIAIAAVLYYVGIRLKRAVPVLDRLNIPAAVMGGLLAATVLLIARDRIVNLEFDSSAQPLFMVAFFTTIGMSASLSVLKKGGFQVAVFLLFSTLFCLLQNFLGIGISSLFGVNPLLGVIAGSVTLVGGPATGLAFAPIFEDHGVTGAATLAMTAATFGIVFGGLTGGPVGTWLIKRFSLHARPDASKAEGKRELASEEEILRVVVNREDSSFIVNAITTAAAMGLGTILTYGFRQLQWTLPAYIGAMMIASVFRNIDDRTGWLKIDQSAMEFIGMIALNIFLVVALMNLRLWDLLNLAVPLFSILVAQVLAVTLFAALISYRLMGRDYDAAVMSSGFIGFALGTTANAMANMKTLVAKYGPAPRAFLVVPMVGAFFIDFTNAIIITFFINVYR
jgi:glutamate:Na+ symporter, ESS family